TQVMKRREFVRAVGRFGGLAVGARFAGFQPLNRPTAQPSLLIPMDDSQTDHLKAYGLTYKAIQAGLKAEWLLNYRGGSFLIPDLDALRRGEIGRASCRGRMEVGGGCWSGESK